MLVKNLFAVVIASALGLTTGYCQADTTRPHAYEDLSLQDLLNVKILSASKESELLFDAPLSASVITKEEIRRAGSTSIMEALRLAPGMIVREESNGNYDIHLRGMDNVPPNASFDITSNTTTLVMINNRPVYSYLRGGTFWETLPIDINDVEKIEVVRGPAAALYGPNAVNGVINIITRNVQKDGLYSVVNSQQGSNHSFIENASVGYRFNKKLNVIASGNYQHRDRTQTSYFEFNRNILIDRPAYFINFKNDTVKNVNTRYPKPHLAMQKYAGNVFVEYNPAEKIKLNLAAGVQHSMVQKVSTENEVTPLSQALSNSRYVDVAADINQLSARFSYNEGTQITDYDPGNKFDFQVMDASIEYNYTKGNFSIKPGLSYRSAIYDDTKYSDISRRAGIFNTRGTITSESASLRAEYKLFRNKMRLVAGFSTNTFNYPNDTYLAYQFAATYKVNKKHLFRGVISRAPRSSNVFDTHVDEALAFFPSGYKKFTEIALAGNKNIKLLTADMFEIGYRGNLSSSVSVEVEIFDIHAKNFSIPVTSRPVVELKGTDTVFHTPVIITNLPLKLQQQGITVSITYSSKKLQVKPFVTLQHTKMKNYAPFPNTPDANMPGAAEKNIYSGIGTEAVLKGTPASYGGAYVNYMLTSKVNINVNSYYYSSQTYSHLSRVLLNDGIRGIDHIQSKFILNARVAYEPVKGLHFFCSGKNILNNTSREFFRTDEVPFMMFGGINYEF